MFGLGIWELIVVAVIALLVLGPKRLPEAARYLGRTIRELRRAANELRIGMDDIDPSVPERRRPAPASQMRLPEPVAETVPSESRPSAEPSERETSKPPNSPDDGKLRGDSTAEAEGRAEGVSESPDSRGDSRVDTGEVP